MFRMLNCVERPNWDTTNPFEFGRPVAESKASVFAGRQDIVRELESAILNSDVPPALLLHGPRRMGKSSILRQLPRLLGPDFAVAEVPELDLANAATFESPGRFLFVLSRAIAGGLRRRHVLAEAPAETAFDGRPHAAFDDWLRGVERELPGKLRMLVCFDEYESLHQRAERGTAWVDDLLDTMRHWLQHHPRLVLLFTGVRTFSDLGERWTRRFVSVRSVRVSFLPRADLIPILTRPLPDFGLVWSQGTLDALLDATAGQPFLTQAMAYELVQHLNDSDRREATLADIGAVERVVYSRAREYLVGVWQDATPEGQAILRAVLRRTAIPEDPRARRILREMELLDDQSRFRVPLVERWMRDNEAAL